MRDVADDNNEKKLEMKAYYLLGKTLTEKAEHKTAIIVLKRLLQIAWFVSSLEYEMKAYEMIAKQYFYLRDLFRADYYYDRYIRGKFEIESSKTRDLSMIQYARKNDIKQKKLLHHEDLPAEKIKVKTEQILVKCAQQIRKIQYRSREGYYKMPKLEPKEIKALIAGLDQSAG